MHTTLLIAALILAAPAPGTTESDWPQWRGHGRDGKSLEKGLIANWGAGPKLAWENAKIGHGYGSPSVVGDKVFILGGTDNNPGSPEFIRCLNLKDGTEVWSTPMGTSAGDYLGGWGAGPRSTPTFANGMLYCLGSTGDLLCVNAKDGKQVWRKNLVKDFGGSIGKPTWGYSESPLVDGDNVICTPGKGTGMVALNAKSGETVWACKEFDDFAQYSSILPVDVGGVRIYLQQAGASSLGVRAKDGKLMFRNKELNRSIAVIPTPVYADGHVFFTSGYGAGCECYKLTASGDTVKAEKVYSKFKTISNHHGGVIQIGDHLYGHNNANKWVCFAFKEAKDDAVWSHQGFGKGSITYVDGHFLCYEENSGNLAVIKATQSGWEQVGKLELPKKSKTSKAKGAIWAHPVVAHGKLFLRDFDLLLAFDLKK
jgi:outer membrane protein assembly factor BamB